MNKENKLKPFNELYKYKFKNVQKKPTFYKDKDGKMQKTHESKWLDYVEWATVLVALYENGANEVFFNSTIAEGKPNTLLIYLCIDGREFKTHYPIIDGNTIIREPNQMQIHKAELRGFVKCVAIHTGLGLSMWQKEESILNEIPPQSEPKPKQNTIDPELLVNVSNKVANAKSREELELIYRENESIYKGNQALTKLFIAKQNEIHKAK